MDFEKIVENFIQFMRDNDLTAGSVTNGLGDKTSIKRDKHGFYKVSTTSEQAVRSV